MPVLNVKGTSFVAVITWCGTNHSSFFRKEEERGKSFRRNIDIRFGFAQTVM